MSDFHICEGSTVLNQDPGHPMVGTIKRCLLNGQEYEVAWSDGSHQWEQPTDLTLTAASEISSSHSHDPDYE